MNITENDHIKLFLIQEELNMTFPYLKLEFFVKPNTHAEEALKKLIQYKNKTPVVNFKGQHKGEIVIKPAMTVLELEQDFRDVYGLEIQLFRKSGKGWIETTVTDSWTLEEQNREGEALSKNRQDE